MTHPTCGAPVGWEVLVDYWAGDLVAADAEAVEEHVFACEACAGRLAGVAALARGISRTARRTGGMRLSATPALIDALSKHGVRMRHYRLGPGESVACTVGADDDLVVTWLRADLMGTERVDLAAYDASGAPLGRWEDMPVDPASGQVLFTLPGDEMRTWPDMVQRICVVAIEQGRERVLGEYTFNHTGYRA